MRAAVGSLGVGAQLGHWLGWVQEPTTKNQTAVDDDGFSVLGSQFAGFDLIVANIIARVLAALAADMAGALRPGGVLISSGIIAEREPDVAEAFAAAGLAQLERRQEGDWVALVHRKA